MKVHFLSAPSIPPFLPVWNPRQNLFKNQNKYFISYLFQKKRWTIFNLISECSIADLFVSVIHFALGKKRNRLHYTRSPNSLSCNHTTGKIQIINSKTQRVIKQEEAPLIPITTWGPAVDSPPLIVTCCFAVLAFLKTWIGLSRCPRIHCK